MLLTWRATVFKLIVNSAAISRLLMPRTINCNT
jgi:hypothetical protein